MRRTHSIVAFGLLIAVCVLLAWSGSAAVAGGPGELERASGALKTAITWEENARAAGASGQWKDAVDDIDTSRKELGYAAADLKAAVSDGEIDGRTEQQVVNDIKDADALDAKADKAAAREDVNSTKHRLAKAIAEKKTALRVIANVTPRTTPPADTNTLASPAGSGTLTVTNVKCYADGTGGNPERDADLSLNGVAGWHAQEVYPASYVKGGSPSAPMVFIENGPAPYTAPTTTIYAAFGTTVSGDISSVGSGQLVMVRGTLVDPKTGLPVTGSNINLNFSCGK